MIPDKYTPNHCICIHGHFYQPPRENPWTGEIERQESAAPFHDWNERVFAESYATNAKAHIMDSNGHTLKILNNYLHISFNFGPTLLSWMEKKFHTTYEAILEADRISVNAHNGHGNAIAQAHSHLILPLCNPRDQITQVIWGLKDFEHRFGRPSEGIWLAETAVDTHTLEVLAAEGVKFTILAPHQAKSVREIGTAEWQSVDGNRVDTSVPYLCRLPSGRQIALFFYDGNISRDVAFDGLLHDGKRLADRLLSGAGSASADKPRLTHIATDGETYGHHHRYGEMALVWCLDHIRQSGKARLVNYGEFLEICPPVHEAQIHENSSWSCAHGIERWRSNCGCNAGRNWHQEWRKPLRDALDWLREELATVFEAAAGPLLINPWAARNDYIDIILDPDNDNSGDFFQKHSRRVLTAAERSRVIHLMELQRNAMYMYTSCGWFFDEISGIETNQILLYACRAIGLAKDINGHNLEPAFVALLAKAPSNLPEIGDGAASYQRYVMSSIKTQGSGGRG